MMVTNNKQTIIKYIYSDESESYKKLGANILVNVEKKQSNIINIMSYTENEKRNDIVLNLAVALSQMNQKILIVDLDLRNSSFSEMLENKNLVGISDIVSENLKIENGLINVMQNLDIMLSGKAVKDISRFISSQKINAILNEASKKYDLVLVNSPGISMFADGFIIAEYCNRTLLVIGSDQNNRKEMKRLNEQLNQMKINVMGIVLAK